MLTLSHSPSRTRHPFENLFVDLGSHSPDQALAALTAAMREELRDMNAFEWLSQALPAHTLGPPNSND
jgi:hypothetical protein